MLAKRSFTLNPILIKELRSRMRGGRAFLIMTLVLLALGLISYLMFRIVLVQLQYSTVPASPQIGQALFSGLALLELMIVCAVTPAVTAGAISGEMEKLTYEMLAATPLRPASILSGKLVSALSYVLILIFAAVPMFSLVFTFGGVTIREMFKAVLVLGSVALMLGVMGMFFSALFGRTGRATVASYLVLACLIVVPYMIYLGRGMLIQATPPREVLIFSPITALFSALQPSLNGQYPTSFMWMLGGGFGPDLWFGTAQMSTEGIPRPIYHYSLPLFGGVTLVLYLLTTRLVQPAHRWRLKLRDVAVGAGVLLVYAGCVALFFYLTSGRYENVLSSTQAVDIPAPPMGQIEPAIQIAPVVPQDIPDQGEAAAGGVGQVVEVNNLSLPPEVQADIYAEVIRRLYTQDHTFGEPPNFATIYVLTVTDDSAGDPNLEMLPASGIPPEVQAMIGKRLVDLPAAVQWVEDSSVVPYDKQTMLIADNGVLMRLGNIRTEGQQVLLSGSLEAGMLIAGGRTYILENQEGTWQITGNTGDEWQR